jgi:hypothetical protein
MKRKSQETTEKKAKKAKSIVIKIEMSMPEFKKAVLANYKKYTAKQILKKFTKEYEKPSTRASQLSLLKGQLGNLPESPPKSFLDNLKLDRSIYSQLKQEYREKTFDKGKPKNHIVIPHASLILQRARQLIQSDDISNQIAGLFVCSGFRFAEVFNPRLLRISKTLQEPIPVECRDHWGCVGKFAKKGKNLKPDTKAHSDCRNKLFLCPVKCVIHVLKRIRDAFPCKGMNNTQISSLYAKKVNNILKEKYVGLFPSIEPTVYTMRYFYAVASFKLYGERHGFIQNTWISQNLGHCLFGPQAYSNVELKDFDSPALCYTLEGLQY